MVDESLSPGPSRRLLWWAMCSGLVGGFVVLLVRTAWVCDDAYIAFRTVDNVVHGRGLTWNPDERVQAFTSPLWVLLVSAAYVWSREVYYTSLLLSMALSAGTVALVVARLARGAWAGVLAGVILCLSKAFVDYSTSGLENPLLHLLLVLFLLAFHEGDGASRPRPALLGLAAGAIGLTRMDALLLVVPAIVWRAFQDPRGRAELLRGALIPLAAWEAFSLLYYGFPFPNTAYAKLAVGIDRADLVRQGLLYLLHSVRVEPLTVGVIASALALGFGARGAWAALCAGIVLFLAYLVWIGGDFMGGGS